MLLTVLVYLCISNTIVKVSSAQRGDKPTSAAVGNGEDERVCVDKNEAEVALPNNYLAGANLHLLQRLVPQSTEEERIRFLIANDGDTALASLQLQRCLEWRREFESTGMEERTCHRPRIKSSVEDALDWRAASDAAVKASGLCESSSSSSQALRLPRILQCCDGKDNETGNRMFCLRTALLNTKVAPVSVYSLAAALYMERKFSRDSLEQVVLAIDVRRHPGCPNPNPIQLIPFIQYTVPLLTALFPERLSKAVVFPVSTPLRWIWSKLGKVLTTINVDEKLIVLSDIPPTMGSLNGLWETTPSAVNKVDTVCIALLGRAVVGISST